jgi:hypothetical protein
MSTLTVLELLTTSKLIYGFLELKSLYSLARTCKDLYCLVNDTGTCKSVTHWNAFRYWWRTTVWSIKMNRTIHRHYLWYEIVFDLPTNTCRLCGAIGRPCDSPCFATGWIVNESIPIDKGISFCKERKWLKKRFKGFTRGFLRDFPYFYITVPICHECFQRWYILLRERRRKHKLHYPVPIFGRCLHMSHVGSNNPPTMSLRCCVRH